MERRYFCGLGNPGDKYARTRHNVGWWVLDALARRWKLGEQGEKHDSKFQRGVVEGVKVTLIWPQTFMNLSGTSLAEWKRREGVEPGRELLVLYDDMDLAPGRLRLRPAGSGGSHNGMKDVVERLGTPAVPRLRLGIGRPADPAEWADFVLHSIPPAERTLLEQAVAKAEAACEAFLKEPDLARLMNTVNAA
ncbi:MAG TPA: aminoacyl-tRNA hydrolase [bacterium]|jgi:PTH1 family peptidyl-tRNA hydrolase|nr:aminoacyl-tRNA hydrolase [bacterium]